MSIALLKHLRDFSLKEWMSHSQLNTKTWVQHWKHTEWGFFFQFLGWVWFLAQTLVQSIALKDLNYYILDLFSRASRCCICNCPSSFLPCPKLSRLQNIYKSWKDMGIYDRLRKEVTSHGYNNKKYQNKIRNNFLVLRQSMSMLSTTH